MEVCIVEKFIK